MARNEDVTVRINVDDRNFRAELQRLRAEIATLRTRAGGTAAASGILDNDLAAPVAGNYGVDIHQSALIQKLALEARAHGDHILRKTMERFNQSDAVLDEMIDLQGKTQAADAEFRRLVMERLGDSRGPTVGGKPPITVITPPGRIERERLNRINDAINTAKSEGVDGLDEAIRGIRRSDRIYYPYHTRSDIFVGTDGGSSFTTPVTAGSAMVTPRSGGASPAPSTPKTSIPKTPKPGSGFIQQRVASGLEGFGGRVLGGSIGLALGVKEANALNKERNEYIRSSLEKGEVPDPSVLNARIIEKFGDQMLSVGTFGLTALHTWLVGIPVAIRTLLGGAGRALADLNIVSRDVGSDTGTMMALSEYYYNSQDWFGINDEAYEKVWDAKREWYKSRAKAAEEANKEAQKIASQVANRLQELGMTGLTKGQLEQSAQAYIEDQMNRKVLRDFDEANPMPTEKSVNPFGRYQSDDIFGSRWFGGTTR